MDLETSKIIECESLPIVDGMALSTGFSENRSIAR